MDRIAVYSIAAVALLGIGALALGMALAQANTSLSTNGDRIEVRGCVRARPFQSNFDRDMMSATYRFVRGRNSDIHELIFRQKGQRTVKIKLGNQERDSKLVLVAPVAMKLYAQKLRETGKGVPPALR